MLLRAVTGGESENYVMWRPASSPHLRLYLLLFAILLSSQRATANEPLQINLAEAVQRTLATNPALNVLSYDIRAQEGARVQAGLKPNPELGLVVENALGSGDLNGFDGAETTLSLGWVLERGKREARIAKADASVSLLETQRHVLRRDMAAETARRYLDSLAIQAQKAQALDSVSVAADTVAQIAERVKAGQAPDADLARARAELARTQLRLEDFEHEQEVANHRLAAQWGERKPDFTSVAGDVLQLPRSAAYAELVDSIRDNPDIKQYATVARLRDAELSQAQAQARPDWQINLGVRHLELVGEQALVAGITMPLPLRNQNQGQIAAARANRQRVEADRTQVELGIETQLFATHQALQHALHVTRTLSTEVLPLTESALRDTQRAYRAGRYTYFQLQQVQQEVLDARLAQVEAAISAHRHAIEIERLTGTVLTQGAL